MTKKTLLIVGDDYGDFAEHAGVRSVSRLWRELTLSSEIDLDCVYFGLGICETERNRLSEALAARGVRCIEGLVPLVKTELTHKRDRTHVLIAGGRKLRNRTYAYELFLDEAQDRLCDHVTGQHVSAMLLVETGRQAVIASLVQQYPSRPDHEMGMVLERLTVDFSSYAFPIPTSLSVVIAENVEPTPKQIDVSLFIAFCQAGQSICDMRFDVKLREERALRKIEDRKASRIVDALLTETYAALA